MIVGVITGAGSRIAGSRDGFFLDDLSNLATVNAYLQTVASSGGGEVFVYPHSRGYHLPESLDSGLSIVVPANVALRAVGLVQVRWDNPTRPCFLMTGTGGALLGQWYVIGDYIAGDADYQWRDGEDQDNWPVNAKISRMDQSWPAGNADYAAWAIAHHAAHPEYPLMAYNAANWSSAWDTAFPHTKWEPSGALKSPNRCAAVASYDADDVVIEDLRISNFISGIMLAGRSGIIPSLEAAPDYQTRNIKIHKVRGDLFEFLVLTSRQANNTIGEAIAEWNGIRIQDKQPHVLYLANEPSDYEYSDFTHVGVVRSKGYIGGSVVKAKAQRGFTWDEIVASGSQSALNILEYCTGVGGNVILEDQCESPSPGTNFAVRINFSPGFVIAGKIKVEHRADVNDLRCLSIENSDDVKILHGVDLAVARASAGQALCRIRNSQRVSVGTFNYNDANSRGSLLWTLSDSQDDGGNASDCTFDFGDVRGTNRLIEFLGLSSNNEIRFDPRRIENFDGDDALVVEGLGSGNYYVDVSSGNRKILALSASTALTAKASNTLSVPRQEATEEEEEEDEAPPPKLFVNNDTVTINGRVYTFKTTLTGAANEVLIPHAGLAGTYGQMAGKEFGYLQMAFLDAAIRLDTAYGAGIGVIYGTGTLINADVTSDWGGNELNVSAKASGTGPNAYVCSVSSTATGATWADGTTSDTLTGGGDFTNSFFNRTLAVTTGASALTMTLPTTAPEGSYVEFVKTDAAVGSVDCGGLVTLRRKDERVTLVYEDGAWRIQSPNLAVKTLADQIITTEQVAACATPADVTALIQKAADAAGVAGGVVQLPPGNITMGASAPVATNEGSAVILETGSNITFRGVPGATVLRPASNKIELFAINGATDTRFEHIHFENTYGPLLNQLGGTFNEGDDPNGGLAAHGNTANCAIRQYRGENLTVRDCTFTDFTTGVDYVGDNDSEATTAGEVIIQRCTFDGCAFAFLPKQPKRIVFTDIDAYDIIDSNGYDSPVTITGITKANPGVVTTSTTHTFTDGEQVYIFGVGGMTQVNGIAFTCKSPTATTFQLYDTAETPAAVNTSGYTTYTTGGTAGEFNNAPGHAIYVANRPGASPDIVEISGIRATGCTSSPIKVRKGGQCTVSNVNLLDNGRGIEVWNVGQLAIDSANIKLAAVSGGSEGNRNALQLTDNGPTEISNVTIDIRGIDAWGVRMLPDLPAVDYANQHTRLTNVTVIQDYVGTGGKAPMIASEQDDLVVEGFRHVHPGMKSGTRAPVDLRDCQRFRVSDVKHIVPDPKTITGITAANPGVITAVGHGLTTGDTVFIDGVLGMTRMNGQDGTVTVLTADTFSMGINTSAYVAYSSGGKVYPADAPRLLVVDASSNDGTFAYRTSDLAVIPTTNTFSNNGTGNRLVRSGTPFVKESPQSTLTINEHDQFVICNRAGGGATTITLPAVAYVGQTHTISDYKGDAATNNITISPNTGFTIRDGASVVINTNYGSATLTLVFPTIWKRTA